MVINRKIFQLSALTIATMIPIAQLQAVEFKVSGQINRAVLWADNGDESEVLHVDNDNSSTRFRFVGSQDVGDGLMVGIVWESQFESNTSSGVDVGQNNDGSSSFTERKLEAWFEGGFGKVSIGQGDGAANGTSEIDLSGTSVVTYSGVGDMMGGVNFVDSAGAPLGVRIKDVFSNFDGLSRNDRLRYDTPSLGPVRLSLSLTNGDAYEVAARLAQDLGGGNRIAAAFGYVDTQDRGSEFQQWGTSVSYLHGSGFNLTLAAGNRDTSGGTDADNWYVKGGYKNGKHAISLDYGMTDDLNADGDEFSTVGVGYVYNMIKGVDLYAAYRNHELDRPGANADDISGLMIGTRIKFF